MESKAKIKTLPIPKVDKKIAIIGGGISGITCASDLNQKGYGVDIFEKESQAGGSFFKGFRKDIRAKSKYKMKLLNLKS